MLNQFVDSWLFLTQLPIHMTYVLQSLLHFFV